MIGLLSPFFLFIIVSREGITMKALLMYLSISDFILIVTLGVIVWYAIETHKLRQETAKQKELQLRPFVMLINFEGKYALKNLGFSPALNVKIENIMTDKFVFYFEEAALVRKDQIYNIKPIKVEAIENMAKGITKSFDDTIISDFPFFPNFKADNYKIKIDYKNMENQEYYTIMNVDCKREKIDFIENKKR